jgi:hypothetical protein
LFISCVPQRAAAALVDSKKQLTAKIPQQSICKDMCFGDMDMCMSV